MSDQIIPIQCDISGMALFQRTQTIEVTEPAGPPPKETRISSAGTGGAGAVSDLMTQDVLNLSKPVKKRLETKVSTFATQLPALAQPRQQELIQNNLQKELKRTEADFELSRRNMPSAFYDLIEQADTSYRQRLEQAQNLNQQPGYHQRPSDHKWPTGLLVQLVR